MTDTTARDPRGARIAIPPAAEAAGDRRPARRTASPGGEGRERILRIVLPAAVLVAFLVLWEAIVDLNGIRHFVLPAPSLVLATLVEDWPILGPALLNTLTVTLLALALATVGGAALAIAFTQARWVEYSFFPLAVLVQVTPIIAIFPLINIYVGNAVAKVLLCAFIVSFFPILSNTALGLNSADRNLRDLFRLYGASRWQTLMLLRIPAAMPYFLGGLRIAGGLALIGVVVAEFVAGNAGIGSGLASRIIESGFRLDIPRLFAALLLISLTGIAIYVALSALSQRLLSKWHESALKTPR